MDQHTGRRPTLHGRRQLKMLLQKPDRPADNCRVIRGSASWQVVHGLSWAQLLGGYPISIDTMLEADHAPESGSYAQLGG